MTPATLQPYREHVLLADKQARRPEGAEASARILVGLFEAIRSESSILQDRIARGEIQYDVRISHAFSELFQELGQAFENIKQHLPPKRLPDRFLEYLDTMRSNQFDVDVIAVAIEDVREGKTISLAEGMDALRDSAAR